MWGFSYHSYSVHMNARLLCSLVALFILTTATASGQGSFKGYMFGDAYYLASHDDGVAEDTDEAIEGANGLWFRRIYLTFDWKFNDAWSARLRTEMGSPGDFTTARTLVPFAKDAYVRWKRGNHQITLGMSGTPTWGVIEDFWGYRSVEKTLLDLQRIASSRDVGVAFKGSLDQDQKFRYNLMLGNGNSNRNDNNQGKKVLLSLGFFPNDSIILEGYVDYDDRPEETDRLTAQGFLGYQQEKGRIGVQYFYQSRDNGDDDSVELSGLSLFGAVNLSEKTNAFARYDMMMDADDDMIANPDAGRISYVPFNAAAESSNMVLAGIDYMPHPQVHFMPNIQAVFYGGDDSPDATILPRLTFWVIFR